MRTLWLANGINIVLGPMLVFGVGRPGAGRDRRGDRDHGRPGIGVMYQLRVAAGRGHLAVRREHLGIDRAVRATILRLSGTASSRY